nr:hypothetical protein [Tanacetum cinerariifolium]
MCKLLEDVQNINEELSEFTNSLSWDRPMIVNDKEHSIQFMLNLENSSNAIAPDLPTEEPNVKNLVPIPSESEVTFDNESECDVPIKDESSPLFTTFSNPLFDCNDDFTSSDDESLSNEDFPMENFKIYSNPLFDDGEIISNKIDPHYFNVESSLIESLLNRDTLFDSSPKFDYLEEFSGELMLTSIINEERIRREHEESISLMEKLLTINSFPRPIENFHANTIIETLPTSPILVEDSDSLRQEIDIFTGTDDLMPPGIESDDYDSKEDIHILEEFLSNDTPPISKNESSNFDHHNDPSFPRPPPKPSDVEVFLEPDSGILTTNVVKGGGWTNRRVTRVILGTVADQKKVQYENLVPILSESEVTSDNESECDVPIKDESSPPFTTFSNSLFDCNEDFTSSDDESLSNEDVPMENFKIYSNPLFDDGEIISNKIDPPYLNVESNLIESLLNRDTLFDSSPKFDYLEEFSGELMPTSIINEERIRREHEEYISLMEKLLTINLFPRSIENFHANTIIETLPTSHIPVEDSDSLREEIDIFTDTDDLMPPGIESDDYDSQGDIHILEEFLSNDTPPISKNESSNFDHHNDPSFPRPPPEPPDVEVFFEPDSGILTTNVVKGISEHYVLMPNIFPTIPTFDPLYPVYDTLLLFSSENEDKVFKPGILSYLLVSHRDKITSDFSKNPMMMYGRDIPLLDVPYLHFYPLDQAQVWGIESGLRLG